MLLCDFWKDIETIVRVYLMQRLETLGALTDMQWGSQALYELVSEKMHTLTGLLDAVTCRIGVK